MAILRTHPFFEIIPIRGQGCRVWDRDGREYLDLLAGVWSLILGYRHPLFTAAMKDQMEKLVHVGSGFLTGEIRRAAERLSSILPSPLSQVTFLSSGSEAVELAFRLARVSTGRKRVLGFRRGYYGATAQARAVASGGSAAATLDASMQFLCPHCEQCSMQKTYPACDIACLRLSAAQIEAKTSIEEVAAIIFEPVQAVGGIIVPPPGYLKDLAALARRWGARLIADEVTTGLGRTGKWFGFDHEGIVPDIVAVGKALGNGLPVSAVVTTPEIEEACAGRFRHVQSHQNDPFSGRAAGIVIEILEQEGLVARAEAMGEYLLAGLRRLQEDFSAIHEVRARGLMAAIELAREPDWLGKRLHHYLLERGIILDYQPSLQILRLFPPYIIEERHIDTSLIILREGLSRLGVG